MAAVTEDFAKKCEVKQNETLGRWVHPLKGVAID